MRGKGVLRCGVCGWVMAFKSGLAPSRFFDLDWDDDIKSVFLSPPALSIRQSPRTGIPVLWDFHLTVSQLVNLR